MERVLSGEQIRSSKLDREVMEMLNRQQETSLQNLELSEQLAEAHQTLTAVRNQLSSAEEWRDRETEARERAEGELQQARQSLVTLRMENSRERERADLETQRSRDYAEKVAEMKRENEQLRREVERMMEKLDETEQGLKRSREEEVESLRGEL